MNGLIVKQAGRPQQVIASCVRMILGYRYGMDILIAADVVDASALLRERNQNIRAVFIVQSQAIPSRTTIPALGNQGQHPLFLLMPRRLADDRREGVTRTRSRYPRIRLPRRNSPGGREPRTSWPSCSTISIRRLKGI